MPLVKHFSLPHPALWRLFTSRKYILGYTLRRLYLSVSPHHASHLGAMYIQKIYYGLYTKMPLFKRFYPSRLTLRGLCKSKNIYYGLYIMFIVYVWVRKMAQPPRTHLNQGSHLIQPPERIPMGSLAFKPITSMPRL